MRRVPVVLVVDDDPSIVRSFRRVVSAEADVLTAHSVAEARAVLLERVIDLLVTDYTMPGETGEVLLRHVAQTQPSARRVLMTAVDRVTVEPLLADGSAHEVMEKPTRIDELLQLVRSAA